MPQLAPNATGRTARRSRRPIAAAVVTPIMVRPWVSKVMVATTGRPVRAAPATAASSSSTAEIGLDPQHVAAAIRQSLRLLGERRLAGLPAQGPDRGEDLAGRPHRARDQDRPAGVVGDRPGKARRGAVQGADLRLRAMQAEAETIGAEAVGQNEIRAGVDEALVHRAHALRLLQVPQLGRCAGLEAEREQAGAHGAVGDHHGLAREQGAERIGHDQIKRELGQAAPPALRRRRGRLSAALVRPAARRRARRFCTIARRSASSAVGQQAISSSVRMQPAHRPEVGSSRHTPMHGEGISLIRRSSFQHRAAHRLIGQIEDQRPPRKRGPGRRPFRTSRTSTHAGVWVDGGQTAH